MDHKYIVKLLDYDIEEKKLLITLEYAEFGDLFKFFKHLRKFNHQ